MTGAGRGPMLLAGHLEPVSTEPRRAGATVVGTPES